MASHSVVRSVENLHASANSRASSDSKLLLGDNSNSSQEGIESIQARKERLWSASAHPETGSNLLGSNLVAASAMDLRDIENDTAYLKSRRTFTRTLSVDNKSKRFSPNVFLKQDRMRQETNAASSPHPGFSRPRSVAAQPAKPPTLPRKVSRLGLGCRPAVAKRNLDMDPDSGVSPPATTDNAVVSNSPQKATPKPAITTNVSRNVGEASSTSSNQADRTDEQAKNTRYVNVSIASPRTVTADGSESQANAQYSSLHNHDKVHSEYDELKRSIRRAADRRRAETHSVYDARDESGLRKTSVIATFSPQPFSKPPSSPSSRHVSASSPPADLSDIVARASQLHGSVSSKGLF